MNSQVNSLRGKDADPPAGDPVVADAIYRQQVALTRLLASPGWSGPVLLDHPGTNPDKVAISDSTLNWVDEKARFLCLGTRIWPPPATARRGLQARAPHRRQPFPAASLSKAPPTAPPRKPTRMVN
jgi:hypothetical protein